MNKQWQAATGVDQARWEDSEAVESLLHMADPESSKPYLGLPEGVKPFVDAKKKNCHLHHPLGDYEGPKPLPNATAKNITPADFNSASEKQKQTTVPAEAAELQHLVDEMQRPLNQQPGGPFGPVLEKALETAMAWPDVYKHQLANAADQFFRESGFYSKKNKKRRDRLKGLIMALRESN